MIWTNKIDLQTNFHPSKYDSPTRSIGNFFFPNFRNDVFHLTIQIQSMTKN